MPLFGFRRPPLNGHTAPAPAPSGSAKPAAGAVTRQAVGGVNGSIDEAAVLQALRSVEDPDLHRDVVSLGMIMNIAITPGDAGAAVAFTFELTTPACPVRDQLQEAARAAVQAIPGVSAVQVAMTARVRGGQQRAELPGVRNTIGIASGKGGVGKSTIATNLAVALAQTGARVGLLDADVYGPSVPAMVGLHESPQVINERLQPLRAYGLHVMSMGFLVPDEQAVVWRGPMISQAVAQMIRDVDWGDLDYLLIDLPPGTGDIQLTIAQVLNLSGVVIVSTPQHVALGIAAKAHAMFKQLHVPILGVVENMSYFLCPRCGERTDIFSHGGAQRLCEQVHAPFLGEVPLDEQVRESGDRGIPISAQPEASAQRDAFERIAKAVAAQVSIRAARALPLLQIEKR
ncbi:MAG TPA: Mrp/NBP35 family ATP-binding protein [Chloroflexota bacterium]|nr:Mrp/NBP35 family ATP-binding protein [Chloroflexota bacterium]